MAANVATTLIQSLTLIHGGALIAIPAFAGPFDKILKSPLFGWTFGFFALGLTLVIAAGIVSFFALARRSDEKLTVEASGPRGRHAGRATPHQLPASEVDRCPVDYCIICLSGAPSPTSLLHSQRRARILTSLRAMRAIAGSLPSYSGGISIPRNPAIGRNQKYFGALSASDTPALFRSHFGLKEDTPHGAGTISNWGDHHTWTQSSSYSTRTAPTTRTTRTRSTRRPAFYRMGGNYSTFRRSPPRSECHVSLLRGSAPPDGPVIRFVRTWSGACSII